MEGLPSQTNVFASWFNSSQRLPRIRTSKVSSWFSTSCHPTQIYQFSAMVQTNEQVDFTAPCHQGILKPNCPSACDSESSRFVCIDMSTVPSLEDFLDIFATKSDPLHPLLKVSKRQTAKKKASLNCSKLKSHKFCHFDTVWLI